MPDKTDAPDKTTDAPDPEEQLREAYRNKPLGAPVPGNVDEAEEKFLRQVEERLERTAPLLPPRESRSGGITGALANAVKRVRRSR